MIRGKTVLVNAGPTHEGIDPVRFIGNYSSGKMGIAIANEAFKRGARVRLVLGPVEEKHISDGIETIHVVSAEEMANETLRYFGECDIAILAAAVSDYTPRSMSTSKIKKKNEELIIRLKPTRDIAAELGEIKQQGQLLTGFALETDNEHMNAKSKLKRKNFDLIVLNSLKDEGAGFWSDTNRVTLIDKNNNIEKFELKSKARVAVDIFDKIETML
ncbi:MAG: phosphopantothenoylcysteine decarboxylase [Bacteroidota bacterium]|nr:phosphopantothenoylcysteine decarboxylase [Bacteroidota bacterium]